MVLNRILGFTIYVTGWALFLDFFSRGLPIRALFTIFFFPFVVYFFSCSLVTWHLIFPCGIRYFWEFDFAKVLFRFWWKTCFFSRCIILLSIFYYSIYSIYSIILLSLIYTLFICTIYIVGELCKSFQRVLIFCF